jgi:4-carboxymuconolactone decarboxylase
MAESRRDRGLAMRRRVMGDEHVDRALTSATSLSEPFQEFLTEYCWGQWASEGLDPRTRSLITMAILGALGRSQELSGHLRGARRNGCTDDEIRECLMHIAIYAGIPAGVEAFRLANAAAAEAESQEKR